MRSHLFAFTLIILVLSQGASVGWAAPATASFTPGSTWVNDDNSMRLTINDVQGESFHGTFVVGKNILRQITGTFKGQQVSWLARDVKALKGKPGHDNFGTLAGDTLHFVYKSPGSSKEDGTFFLRRAGGLQPAQAPQQPPAQTGTLAAIQTDPSQPRIQVIREQGPNATEWVLTPLDEAIPQDIRQNLTFLREDLLDEARKTPKSTADAYAQASTYCDKILAALDLRDQSRVKAGYRAAQADANKAFTNQALSARRNHMMSWPQYAREESQRAAMRENETDKADVKKEQLKVEWNDRAQQMRSYLDDLYRKLREAMR